MTQWGQQKDEARIADSRSSSDTQSPRDFSTLPEVVPYTTFPEVVPTTATSRVPEKADPDAPIPAGVLPPPFSEVDTGPHQLDGDETTVADSMARPVAWYHRRRNRFIVAGVVIVVLLIVIGVSVGVGVPLSRRKR